MPLYIVFANRTDDLVPQPYLVSARSRQEVYDTWSGNSDICVVTPAELKKAARKYETGELELVESEKTEEVEA